jgi:hypothetical protein
MSRTYVAGQRWSELHGVRQGFINRCEGYASLTIRKLCLPEGYDQYSSDLQHDWQSVGAQAVNHLSNKLMLALFAPSRPFFRLDPTQAYLTKLAQAQIDKSTLSEALAAGEADAVKELDQSSSRPKLYEILKHLVVTGNCLMILGKDGMRVMGIKHYCVKRAADGKILEILIRECVKFDELDPEAQAELFSAGYQPDTKVDLFKWVCRNSAGKFELKTFVGNIKLSKAFEGSWPEDQCPYRALTWDLADDSDYGTGLVEDYAGDFQALSALSEAQVTAAILASEFRWLVNPAGMTKAEDFTNSVNGSAIPGVEGDVHLIQSGKAQDLQVIQAVNADYIQRIGRGFLLGSAVTRNAERVTAVEMRMQAEELETSLGGAYSRLAVDLQKPICFWLLKRINLTFNGKEFQPVVVTGLDALSRSGDLENLKLFLGDLAAVSQLPPGLQSLLRLRSLAQAFASARGIKSTEFLKTDEEVQQEAQAQQQQALQQQAQSAGIDAAAQQQAAQQGQAQ